MEMLNCGIPLAPHNLLDNSDFTNAVNQRGATTATLGKYFIDRWSTEPFPNGPSITIDGNGLTLLPTTSSTAGIYQQLPDYENRKGKVHTFAICVGDVWKCFSFTMGNFGVGYFIHGLSFFSVDNRNILIRNNNSDNPAPITIQRVALYEGAYTADTLPSYVPKGKRVEMLNCNVPLTPHNLLDNSDFRNPVNQRGIQSGASITEYTYCLDRWMNFGATAGTLTLNENGISFTMTNFNQRLPETIKTGTVVTAVAKWNDGTIVTVTGTITRGNTWTWFTAANNEHQIGVIDMGNNKEAHFTILGGSGVVEWAALYEGAYDASTLPAYQPKGYAAELAECQRYYVHCGEASWMTGLFKVGEGLIVEIPTANNIRIPNPTIIVNSPKVFTTNGWYDITYASCNVTKCWTKLLFNFPEAASQFMSYYGAYIITGIVGVSADL